jgi:transglutaminase-like putative cysteine protease
MLLQITHRTHYRYTQPVFLEPFTVRLRPRSDANQTVRSYRIDIAPAPSGIAHCLGLDGNNNETIWFSGLHQDLRVEAYTVVETHHVDPFNFLITDPTALRLPYKYHYNQYVALFHYLKCAGDSSEVDAFVQEILLAAKYETISFLMLLAEQIPTRLKYAARTWRLMDG